MPRNTLAVCLRVSLWSFALLHLVNARSRRQQPEGRRHPQLARNLKFVNKSNVPLDLYFVDPNTMVVELVQESIQDDIKLNLETYVGQHFAVQTVECRHLWDQHSSCNLHYFFASEGQNQGATYAREFFLAHIGEILTSLLLFLFPRSLPSLDMS